MHLVIIKIQITIVGVISKKNPIILINNQIPAYTTAVGTQSSAATIPVNLDCAKNACNVSGDNVIGIIVDTIYKKYILKK